MYIELGSLLSNLSTTSNIVLKDTIFRLSTERQISLYIITANTGQSDIILDCIHDCNTVENPTNLTICPRNKDTFLMNWDLAPPHVSQSE